MIKNIFKLFTAALLVAGVSSCSKDEIGGTAVQDMCGEWYVMVDGVDENGNVTMEDPFGMGYFPLYTYNTNANVDNEMYIDDRSFWGFQVIANVNYAAKTFSAASAYMYDDYDEETEEVYPVHVDITKGQIVKDGAISPAGYTADSISFVVVFEDDPYIEAGYWDALWFHGYRRTGLDGGYD